MKYKDIFEKLSQVDREHFAIVEKENIEIYKNVEYLSTPIPKGTIAVRIDVINELKITLKELLEVDGNMTQKEVCEFILSYMKQIGLIV